MLKKQNLTHPKAAKLATLELNMFSKQISGPHNHSVAIIIFYIKNDSFLRQNLIKIFTKMHQIT